MGAATDIEKALKDFEHSDENRPAHLLLKASGRHIVIAEENEGGGMQTVYYLNEHGFMESVEPRGYRLLYCDERTGNKPQVKMASKQSIALLIARQSNGKATAEDVLNVLRKGLDAIAEQANK